MEAIFIVAVVLGLASSIAFASVETRHANEAALIADATVQTVTILAPRLRAGEK
jgi:Ca2+/Na+ antiporter